ncbi:MAG: NTP transferase domain-containing protein [Rhodanobacteraceae bacterium]|nr:NTP transferase domain-containing protein [Rhodanobacteraceae bacterium]
MSDSPAALHSHIELTVGIRPDAILVARCSSTRLPGKVLRMVQGRPMIEYVIEKLRRCSSVGRICIATSMDRSDDPLEKWCNKNNVLCFRGSLTNVAERVLGAAEMSGCSAFFRVNGDSPLLATSLLDRALDAYLGSNLDVVTNVHPRSYPPGMSVELIKTDSMRTAVGQMTESRDQEHVTAYFYANEHRFAIKNICSQTNYSSVHLAVDTELDLILIDSILGKMKRPHWMYDVDDVLALYHEVQNCGQD